MGGGVKEPETLVFGAKLRCMVGTERSYLFVSDWKKKNIKELPEACVTDRVAYENIMPFGICLATRNPCVPQPADEWENPEGQNTSTNKKQIITTASHLACEAAGAHIVPEDSGQDGIIGSQLKFLAEMSEKYSALFDILENPYASVYLSEGMWEQALEFLEDAAYWKGGDILLNRLNTNRIADIYIIAAITHLTGFDMTKPVFSNDLQSLARLNELFPDCSCLNAGSLETFKNGFGADYAKRVAEGGSDKWRQENKKTIASLEFLFELAVAFGTAYAWNSVGRPSVNSGRNTLNSVDDIKKNPQSLYGMTKDEVKKILGDGWAEGTYGSNRTGWKFTNGDQSIFYHPGGGRHGGSYYGYSSGATGKIKIVGPGYIPLTGDKATIIYGK
ncbi:MAG: DUF4280 domain-containing protein [Peptococcaceae bacterium]|nr:DUF4280 domain-containing protein [Peptococcaceae bacterium]